MPVSSIKSITIGYQSSIKIQIHLKIKVFPNWTNKLAKPSKKERIKARLIKGSFIQISTKLTLTNLWIITKQNILT